MTPREHFDGVHRGNYQNQTNGYYDSVTGILISPNRRIYKPALEHAEKLLLEKNATHIKGGSN